MLLCSTRRLCGRGSHDMFGTIWVWICSQDMVERAGWNNTRNVPEECQCASRPPSVYAFRVCLEAVWIIPLGFLRLWSVGRIRECAMPYCRTLKMNLLDALETHDNKIRISVPNGTCTSDNSSFGRRSLKLVCNKYKPASDELNGLWAKLYNWCVANRKMLYLDVFIFWLWNLKLWIDKQLFSNRICMTNMKWNTFMYLRYIIFSIGNMQFFFECTLNDNY